jgi:hypothetical protein
MPVMMLEHCEINEECGRIALCQGNELGCLLFTHRIAASLQPEKQRQVLPDLKGKVV